MSHPLTPKLLQVKDFLVALFDENEITPWLESKGKQYKDDIHKFKEDLSQVIKETKDWQRFHIALTGFHIKMTCKTHTKRLHEVKIEEKEQEKKKRKFDLSSSHSLKRKYSHSKLNIQQSSLKSSPTKQTKASAKPMPLEFPIHIVTYGLKDNIEVNMEKLLYDMPEVSTFLQNRLSFLFALSKEWQNRFGNDLAYCPVARDFNTSVNQLIKRTIDELCSFIWYEHQKGSEYNVFNAIDKLSIAGKDVQAIELAWNELAKQVSENRIYMMEKSIEFLEKNLPAVEKNNLTKSLGDQVNNLIYGLTRLTGHGTKYSEYLKKLNNIVDTYFPRVETEEDKTPPLPEIDGTKEDADKSSGLPALVSKLNPKETYVSISMQLANRESVPTESTITCSPSRLKEETELEMPCTNLSRLEDTLRQLNKVESEENTESLSAIQVFKKQRFSILRRAGSCSAEAGTKLAEKAETSPDSCPYTLN